MKKLLIISLMAFTLCACENPADDQTKDKETIILAENTAETTGDENSGSDDEVIAPDDEKPAEEESAESTPTPVSATNDQDADSEEPGPSPTPTPTVSILPDGGDIVIDIGTTAAKGNYAKGKELFCAAASEKEGKDIAALYGITFVDYGYGIATFTTAEDPAAVVKRGKDNGWKELEINYTSSIK